MLSFLGNSKPSESSVSSTSSPSASSSLDSSSLPSFSTSLVETKTPSYSILSAPYSALSSVAKSASEAAKSASDAAKSATASVGESVSSVVSSASEVAKSASDAAKSASNAAKSATASVGERISSSSSLVSESSSSSSLFSFDFDMWTVLRYFGIVLILSFLGINLFGNLGKFTETVRDMLKPLLVILGIGAAETVKTTVNLGAAGADVAAKGADVAAKGADVAAKTVTSGINILEKGISKKGGAKINKIDDNSKIDMNLLNNAVNKQNKNTDDYEPEPDEAGSRTQSSKAKLKSGFCYIGEDRGFRRCIKVGEGDKCMSGDIFPTDEICVNPSLRE